MVVVGKVIKPIGIRGEVQIHVMTDSPDRFSVGGSIFLNDVEHRVGRASSQHKGKINLKLDGIDNRDQAEKLRDATLTVTADMVADLPEGMFYHYQIVDMKVYTQEGEELGCIVDILAAGGADVYVVRGDSGEILIPGLEDVILEIDMVKNRMTVALPEGLR